MEKKEKEESIPFYENLDIAVDNINAYKYQPNYDFPESLCYFIKNSSIDIKLFKPKVIEANIAPLSNQLSNKNTN